MTGSGAVVSCCWDQHLSTVGWCVLPPNTREHQGVMPIWTFPWDNQVSRSRVLSSKWFLFLFYTTALCCIWLWLWCFKLIIMMMEFRTVHWRMHACAHVLLVIISILRIPVRQCNVHPAVLSSVLLFSLLVWPVQWHVASAPPALLSPSRPQHVLYLNTDYFYLLSAPYCSSYLTAPYL